MSLDPRATSTEKLVPPAPLPHVSRRALKRVKDALPIPQFCRYCHSAVKLVNNIEIYRRRSYGDWPYAYLCSGCRAYVGLHPDTDLPLGTLADKPTRDARNDCKKTFERIFKEHHMTRKEAYGWLAEQLGLSVEDCHFGLFEADQCHKAWQVSTLYLDGHHA